MKKYIKNLLLIIVFLFSFLPKVFAQETLTWADCLAQAKKNNPDLISAQETIYQAQQDKNISASGLFPQIDATVSASRSKSGSSTSKPTDSYAYGVSASQLLFDGAQTVNKVETDLENIKVSQLEYKFVSSQVRFNLRSAFINLIKAQSSITLSQEIVKIRQDNVDLIQLRYSSGLEHRGALLTAQANLAQAKYDLAHAKRNVEYYQRQLSKQMGQKEFSPIQLKEDLTVKNIDLEKPDFDVLAKQYPSVLQSIAQINIAQLAIKTAYADFLPTITGEASAGKSGTTFLPQNSKWDLGVNLNVPLFEGGLKAAQLAKAKSEYNKAAADLRSLQDSIAVKLQQAWVGYQDSLELVQVKEKVLEAAKERSKIAQAQYSTGFTTFDNWIIIENDLVNAKNAYLDAQANALLAQANWIQVKGETLEYVEP